VRAAAFLDRDGTIIRDADYLADPDGVELLPGAVEGMRKLSEAGFALVIVTNQSGIARGLYTESDFHAVQQRLEQVLREQGVVLDAVFYCPHHPDFTGECDCRKPQLGMYRAAAARLHIDLAASVYIGDRVKDVEPALATGGRGFLVLTGYGEWEARGVPEGVSVVADVREAAELAVRSVE
jgi:D-glycero-D-manno-heptose 1,7-bisphosphate phosphatase